MSLYLYSKYLLKCAGAHQRFILLTTSVSVGHVFRKDTSDCFELSIPKMHIPVSYDAEIFHIALPPAMRVLAVRFNTKEQRLGSIVLYGFSLACCHAGTHP